VRPAVSTVRTGIGIGIGIGGLESGGLTKAHKSGTGKSPPVGFPTNPGLATLKRGSYSATQETRLPHIRPY
jgi:hypothetical protein